MFHKFDDLKKQSLGELQSLAQRLGVTEFTIREYIKTLEKKPRINSKTPWISCIYQRQCKDEILSLVNLGSIIVVDKAKLPKLPPKPLEISKALADDHLLDAFSIEDAIAKDLLPEKLGDVVIICCDFDYRDDVDSTYLQRTQTLQDADKESFIVFCETLLLTPEEAKEEEFPFDHKPEKFEVTTRQLVDLIRPRLYNPSTNMYLA